MRRKERMVKTRRMMLTRMMIRDTEYLDHDGGRGNSRLISARLLAWKILSIS